MHCGFISGWFHAWYVPSSSVSLLPFLSNLFLSLSSIILLFLTFSCSYLPSFGVKVLTAETRCMAIGDRRCEFLIARPNHMKGFLPTNSPRSAASIFLDVPSTELTRAKTAPSLKKSVEIPRLRLPPVETEDAESSDSQ
jgi:hypothetical protein